MAGEKPRNSVGRNPLQSNPSTDQPSAGHDTASALPSNCIFFPLRSLAVGGYLHPGDSRQPACRACIEETSGTGRCGRNRHGGESFFFPPLPCPVLPASIRLPRVNDFTAMTLFSIGYLKPPLLVLEPSLSIYWLGTNSFCSSVQMAAESENGNCDAWAARDPSGVLSPYSFNRRWLPPLLIWRKVASCLALWILSSCYARPISLGYLWTVLFPCLSMQVTFGFQCVWYLLSNEHFQCGTSSAAISARGLSNEIMKLMLTMGIGWTF